ncbi:MAG: hypothetical protein HWE27_12925 [Gammaproteobacteria bacterium]|nr:hypothetical protein [Gammaproteobacteria bacterium]
MAELDSNILDEDLLFALTISSEAKALRLQKMAVFNKVITKSIWLTDHSTSIAKLAFWCDQLNQQHFKALSIPDSEMATIKPWLINNFTPLLNKLAKTMININHPLADLSQILTEAIYLLVSTKQFNCDIKDVHNDTGAIYLLKFSFYFQSSWLSKLIIHTLSLTDFNFPFSKPREKAAPCFLLYRQLLQLWLKTNLPALRCLRDHKLSKQIFVIEPASWRKLFLVCYYYIKKKLRFNP